MNSAFSSPVVIYFIEKYSNRLHKLTLQQKFTVRLELARDNSPSDYTVRLLSTGQHGVDLRYRREEDVTERQVKWDFLGFRIKD